MEETESEVTFTFTHVMSFDKALVKDPLNKAKLVKDAKKVFGEAVNKRLSKWWLTGK